MLEFVTEYVKSSSTHDLFTLCFHLCGHALHHKVLIVTVVLSMAVSGKKGTLN